MERVDHAPGEPAKRAINAEAMLERARVRERWDNSRNADSIVFAMLQRHSCHEQDDGRHRR